MMDALGKREGVEPLMKEACMMFWPGADPVFDAKPMIFQLENCVVDLEKNIFRYGAPTDMTGRCAPITIPQKWLDDPSKIGEEGKAHRQRAWDIVWRIFERNGPFHPHDHYDELGDQDVANFHFLLDLMARHLEGRPLTSFFAKEYPTMKRRRILLDGEPLLHAPPAKRAMQQFCLTCLA